MFTNQVAYAALAGTLLFSGCAISRNHPSTPTVDSEKNNARLRIYLKASERCSAGNFSSIEDVVNARNGLQESATQLLPSESAYKHQTESQLLILNNRITTSKTYLALKQRIIDYFKENPTLVNSLSSTPHERGGYLLIQDGKIVFIEVESGDKKLTELRDGMVRLKNKVSKGQATEQDLEQLLEDIEFGAQCMSLRFSHEDDGSKEQQERIHQLQEVIGNISNYLRREYRSEFLLGPQHIVSEDRRRCEDFYFDTFDKTLIRGSISIPDDHDPRKISFHTHPDLGGNGMEPSPQDLMHSKGAEWVDASGKRHPSKPGIVLSFKGTTVEVWGFDYQRPELIGKFERAKH